ncbi:hypothetical protein GW17_00060232 [Ensete ventricosum]|nr:hypothetical protein GW17_00060232 [Ensete ventricosum]
MKDHREEGSVGRLDCWCSLRGVGVLLTALWRYRRDRGGAAARWSWCASGGARGLQRCRSMTELKLESEDTAAREEWQMQLLVGEEMSLDNEEVMVRLALTPIPC